MPKLYLYPGIHKTGTTYLQSILEGGRQHIEENGFALAKRQKYYKSGLHDWLRRRGPLKNYSPTQMKSVLQYVFDSKDIEKDLIISIENIFGEFSLNPYSKIGIVSYRLQQLFPNHEFNVFIYVRRQDTYLESSFVQSIHKGQNVNINEYIDKYIDANLNWTKIISACRKAYGGENVTVVPFEGIKENKKKYLRRFYKSFLGDRYLDFENLVSSFNEERNQSLSKQGVDIAIAAFEVIESIKERERFAKIIQNYYNASNGDRVSLSDDQRLKIAIKYRDVNRSMVARNNFGEKMMHIYEFRDQI